MREHRVIIDCRPVPHASLGNVACRSPDMQETWARDGQTSSSASSSTSSSSSGGSDAGGDQLLDLSALQHSTTTEEALSQLYHSGSAARWRRKEAQEEYFGYKTRLAAVRERSMEEVHGVDVSWLHQPNRGALLQLMMSGSSIAGASGASMDIDGHGHGTSCLVH